MLFHFNRAAFYFVAVTIGPITIDIILMTMKNEFEMVTEQNEYYTHVACAASANFHTRLVDFRLI